jgi:hypothetical protein
MKVFLALAAVALIVGGWYGGGPLVRSFVGPTSGPRHNGPAPAFIAAIGPVALSYEQLFAKSAALAEPLYWAGPVNGDSYEFTRTTNGHLFIRYLPFGVRAGALSGRLPIVATYPFPLAYKALRRAARGRGVTGPGGRFIYERPDDPRSVLLAFPRVPYEIEVYNPRPADAMAMAKSGNLAPIS